MKKTTVTTLAGAFALCALNFGAIESIAADADLRVTAFSIFEPNPIAPGARLTRMGYSVINYGPNSSRIQVTIYLSPNSVFGDSDDINLGSFTSSSTFPAGSLSSNTISSPSGLPFTAPSTQGSYYAFLRAIPDPTRTIVDPDLSDNVAQYAGQVTVGTKPPPFVTSITRLDPSASLTAATFVIYRVTFSETVSGVSTSDFTLATASGVLTNGVITSVNTNVGSQIDVEVSTGTGDGTLRLDVLVPGATITDGIGQGLSGSFTTGEVYSIDKTPPTITEIVAVTPNPRASAVTNVDVIFSEAIASSTFTMPDVLLTRNDNPIPLADTITISSLSNVTYRIGGLESLTASEGTYSLTISTAGIQDLAGNPGISSHSAAWSLSRPSMAIRISTDQILISWPSWAEGYELEEEFNFSPSGWLTVTNLPVIAADQKTVMLNNTGTNRYFRLKKP